MSHSTSMGSPHFPHWFPARTATDRPHLDRRLPRWPAVRLRHRRGQRCGRPDASRARALYLQVGVVISSLVFAAAVGALIGGKISDAIGRRKTIIVLAVMFFLGVLFVVFSPGFAILVVGRIILGLAVGGASTVVPVYLAELAPFEIRGSITGRNELAIVVGQFVAFVVNCDPFRHARAHRGCVAHHVRGLRATRDRPVLRHDADARVAALARREGPR